jgi:phage FluMu protein gp41
VTGKVQDQVKYTSTQTRMVRMTELEGKDFFDAVISIQTIVGFIVRDENK